MRLLTAVFTSHLVRARIPRGAENVSDVETTEAIPEPAPLATNGVKPAASKLKGSRSAHTRRRKRRSAKAKGSSDTKSESRVGPKPFPASTFEEALELPIAI